MIARRTAWLAVAAVALSAACGADTPVLALRELDLGPHHIQVSVPEGWEFLDQGAQKRFRKGESEVVMENLGKADLEASALKMIGDDERREVKVRRPLTIDGHQAVAIETWSRLDHTWPERLLFVGVDDDVIALHTERLVDDSVAKAFESIQGSLHFGASVRR